MKTENAVTKLINSRIQEAVAGTITAEKVPTGGSAQGGYGKGKNFGADEAGDKCKTLTVTCSDDCCDTVIQALSALNSAGAAISCKCGDEEVCLKEPEGEDGTEDHEEAESADHEAVEHAAGNEDEDGKK